MQVTAGLLSSILCAAFWGASPAVPRETITRTGSDRSAPAASLDSDRMVHRFDFDERPEGNLEDLPKFWEPLHGEGFPRFTEGRFALEVGRERPPSFHLHSLGRSAAYMYRGPETRVIPSAEYRVSGWIRPDSLVHARATLAAVYLDEERSPLAESFVRASWIGDEQTGDWYPIELYLPAAPAGARSIGVIACVAQDEWWNTRPVGPRHIHARDTGGGAWFDDIEVHSLPGVSLRTSDPANLLPAGGPAHIYARVAEEGEAELAAELTVTDADGWAVARADVPLSWHSNEEPFWFPVAHLPPGVYEAKLEVADKGRPIVTRRLRFARLADLGGSASRGSFGLSLDPAQRAEPNLELALLKELPVRAVKLPVWSGPESGGSDESAALDRLVPALEREGLDLIGVFGSEAAGGGATGRGTYRRSLWEVLSSSPSSWGSDLSAATAPFAADFRAWQVGQDLPGRPVPVEQLRQAILNLREVLGQFISMPHLILPVDQGVELPSTPLPVEQISWLLRSVQHVEAGEERVTRMKEGWPGLRSAFVAPEPADVYARVPRLADFARRLLVARHLVGPDVFAPQPWRVRSTPSGRVVEPGEEFLVLRTIAVVIGQAVPAGRLYIGEDGECLVFTRGSEAVLAIWTTASRPEPLTVPLELGSEAAVFDIWGNQVAVDRDERGRSLVPLSATPLLVRQGDRELLEFRAGIAVTPFVLESGEAISPLGLSLENSSSGPISGRLLVRLPVDWEVTPTSVEFTILPGQSSITPLELRLPHNAPAGTHEIIVDVLFADGRSVEAPVPVTLAVSDLVVRGTTWFEGNRLLVRQTVTNDGHRPADFRASALVPGRLRQYRPIARLAPGSTQTLLYSFADADSLAGEEVRVELRELNDGPRRHSLVLTIP